MHAGKILIRLQDVQSDLNLHGAHMAEGTFSDIVAQIVFGTNNSPLQKHTYSNILKILLPKNENFQIKKF